MSKSPSTEHPSFACDLLALTPAQRDRHRELLTQLIGRRVGVREFPDGVALGFQRDATLRKKLEEWVSYERICCPFLTWTLADEGVGKVIWLRATGGPGVKNFVVAILRLQGP